MASATASALPSGPPIPAFRRPLFSLGDAHANVFGGPAEGTIELVDFLTGNEFECVVAENMGKHRFNLYACEIHADADVWTTAEADQ